MLIIKNNVVEARDDMNAVIHVCVQMSSIKIANDGLDYKLNMHEGHKYKSQTSLRKECRF